MASRAFRGGTGLFLLSQSSGACSTIGERGTTTVWIVVPGESALPDDDHVWEAAEKETRRIYRIRTIQLTSVLMSVLNGPVSQEIQELSWR